MSTLFVWYVILTNHREVPARKVWETCNPKMARAFLDGGFLCILVINGRHRTIQNAEQLDALVAGSQGWLDVQHSS